MGTGPEPAGELPAAPLPELELEPHPALPAMSTAAASPAADLPKRLRRPIGPPVSTSSGCTPAPSRPGREAHAWQRAWKIDPMYRGCQRVVLTTPWTVTKL